MEQEKIKEIKKALASSFITDLDYIVNIDGEPTMKRLWIGSVINLINELESENERLQNDCTDIAKDYQEMGRFYDEKCEECDRISKETAEKLLKEFATILITLKTAHLLSEKIHTSAITEGGYLFVMRGLNKLAKQYDIEIKE